MTPLEAIKTAKATDNQSPEEEFAIRCRMATYLLAEKAARVESLAQLLHVAKAGKKGATALLGVMAEAGKLSLAIQAYLSGEKAWSSLAFFVEGVQIAVKALSKVDPISYHKIKRYWNGETWLLQVTQRGTHQDINNLLAPLREQDQVLASFMTAIMDSLDEGEPVEERNFLYDQACQYLTRAPKAQLPLVYG